MRAIDGEMMGLYDMLLPESPYVFYDNDRGYCINTADVLALIAQLSVTGHWIPCSERLPEELEEVNVTWVNHKPEPYYDFVKDKPFTASAVYYKGDWYWYSSICADLLVEYGKNEIDKIDGAIEIMAWMPFPEAYREGES